MPERSANEGAPVEVAPGLSAQVLTSLPELEKIATEWDELARVGGSLFTTVAWLSSWWEAYGRGTPAVVVVRDASGRLLAGVPCCRVSRTAWASMSNIQSGRWEVLAVDQKAQRHAWRALARLAPPGIRLHGLVEDDESTAIARTELAAAGYRVVLTSGLRSPFLPLPASSEELMASVSHSLRSQVNRKRRALEKLGAVRLRVVRGGSALEETLEGVLRVEGSGWKMREGTAILSDPPLERLFRTFAGRASVQGWLRLCLLEVDGQVIAADYSCAFGGDAYMLKTGFDVRFERSSPGLVLRAEALRAAIEEGLTGYDFLGEPDPYKLRWAPGVRPRVRLHAYRGAVTLPESLYWQHGRPALRWLAQRTVRRPRSPVKGP